MAINPIPLTQNKLFLQGRLRRRIERLSALGYPNEVCGLLIGRSDGVNTAVAEVTEARNLARERDRYTVGPDDLLRAEQLAAEMGLDVVGIWYSHPDEEAVPSHTELDGAGSGHSRVIVSVEPGRGVRTRSWRIDGDRFIEELIES
jgi:proteasome lid subunit RPN8/RPN11